MGCKFFGEDNMKRSVLVRVLQKNRISRRYGYNLFFFKGFTRLCRLRNPITIVCKLGPRKPGQWLLFESTGLRTRKVDGVNSGSQLNSQAERGTPPFLNLFVLVGPSVHLDVSHKVWGGPSMLCSVY